MTVAAQLGAPALAITGVRGRSIACCLWTLFQMSSWLCESNGWLNILAMGAGVWLVDDSVFALIVAKRKPMEPGQIKDQNGFLKLAWMGTALVLMIVYSYASALSFSSTLGLHPEVLPELAQMPLNLLGRFGIITKYSLGRGSARKWPAGFPGLEFEGSNEMGSRWHAYDYRYLPQNLSRLAAPGLPLLSRFEATLQNVNLDDQNVSDYELTTSVARGLLQGTPEIQALFATNPFIGEPAHLVSFNFYKYELTELGSYLKDGFFWKRTTLRNYTRALNLSGKTENLIFDPKAGR
ncbi:MAG: lipase maturation factor family protein [Deltaproteobacteria bacterium]|nr:lipase maturation factor family protein [Deltaproteobacteria bacterium]